jgi:hypothetical protein
MATTPWIILELNCDPICEKEKSYFSVKKSFSFLYLNDE